MRTRRLRRGDLSAAGLRQQTALKRQLEQPKTVEHPQRRSAGCTARLEPDRSVAKVARQEQPNDHVVAHLRLTDNCVHFTTHRYRNNPLVLQGPGAGSEVTAAGVFFDLLRLASSLGARF